jgi:hypothetical protein
VGQPVVGVVPVIVPRLCVVGAPSQSATSPRVAVGGVVGGQLPVVGEGFLGGRDRHGAAAHLAIADAKLVERGGEVGQVVGAGGGQFPVGGDGLRGGSNSRQRSARLD